MSQKAKPSGGGAKIGRNKDKCAAYSAAGRRTKNKLRRIRRCNGLDAAEAYKTKIYAGWVPARRAGKAKGPR